MTSTGNYFKTLFKNSQIAISNIAVYDNFWNADNADIADIS
jgi:hypothetical protein